MKQKPGRAEDTANTKDTGDAEDTAGSEEATEAADTPTAPTPAPTPASPELLATSPNLNSELRPEPPSELEVLFNMAAASAIGAVVLMTVGIQLGGEAGKLWLYGASVPTAFAALFMVVWLFRSGLHDQHVRDFNTRERQARELFQAGENAHSWDLARIKLESYIDRNLDQVRMIFLFASGVMILGFLLIGFGVLLIFKGGDALTPALVSSCGGILTEFIGASLMALYRSTMSQANQNLNIIERINAVGMAVQIIEKIEGDPPGLRNRALAGVASQVMEMYYTGQRPTLAPSEESPASPPPAPPADDLTITGST